MNATSIQEPPQTTLLTKDRNAPQSLPEGNTATFDGQEDESTQDTVEIAYQPRAFPNDWRANGGSKPTSPISEARTIQRLIFSNCRKKDCGPLALSHLARAWCALQDSIRIMRGIPLPGQFRPEISEKRVKGFIDVAKSGGSFSEAVEATSGPAGPPKPKRAPFGRKPKPTTVATQPNSTDGPTSAAPVAESQTTDQSATDETGNGA